MTRPLNTMENIKYEAARSANHWFSKSSMRWWRSRVSETVYYTGDDEVGTFFVSSERQDGHPRLYTVRRAWIERPKNAECYLSLETWSEFQEFTTRKAAHKAAQAACDSFKG